MKKEEIEKEADRRFSTVGNEGISNIDSFIKGVEFAKSKMYSEKEIIEMIPKFCNQSCVSCEYISEDRIKKWFKTVKKK